MFRVNIGKLVPEFSVRIPKEPVRVLTAERYLQVKHLSERLLIPFDPISHLGKLEKLFVIFKSTHLMFFHSTGARKCFLQKLRFRKIVCNVIRVLGSRYRTLLENMVPQCFWFVGFEKSSLFGRLLVHENVQKYHWFLFVWSTPFL